MDHPSTWRLAERSQSQERRASEAQAIFPRIGQDVGLVQKRRSGRANHTGVETACFGSQDAGKLTDNFNRSGRARRGRMEERALQPILLHASAKELREDWQK